MTMDVPSFEYIMLCLSLCDHFHHPTVGLVTIFMPPGLQFSTEALHQGNDWMLLEPPTDLAEGGGVQLRSSEALW